MSGGETPTARTRGHAGALLAGLALAAAAFAAGAAAIIGFVPVLLIAALAGVAGWRLTRRRWPRPEEQRAGIVARAPYVLLAGAVAAAAVALAIGYLPAVRSIPYAAADLGLPFCLGALATLGLWRRTAGFSGAPVAAALAVIAVCMVNAFSFFAYPELVISGSAVLQTSAYLLTPGRVFPFYVLAFVLGIPAGLLLCGRGPRIGGGISSVAVICCGVLAAVLGRWTYAGPYALAVGLALLAAVAVWAGARRGSMVLRVVTVGAGAFGLAWLAVGDPHMQWAGLRLTLGNILRRTGPAGRVVSAERTLGRWHVVLSDGDVEAEFRNGNLVDLRQPGMLDQNRGILAMMVLREAYAPAGLKVTAPGRPSGHPGSPETGGGDQPAITSGPILVTAPRNPLAVISKEGLAREKERLAPGGVLALWLPAGNLRVEDLRKALATVGAVFPHYDVYLEGNQAVIIAGDKLRISYAGLTALFPKEPDVSQPGPELMSGAGFTDPMDLLVGFVGVAEDLAGLTAGVRPWSVWRPARPPAMALDLAEPARPAAVLALAQYRMLGAGRLLDRLQFESPAQKTVALRGFGPIYADRTGRTLGGLGLTGAERRGELLRFLTSPLARLDLLAPQQKEQEVRIAVALSALGLRDVAAGVLKDAIKAGKDDFEVNVELAGILEAQADRAEALKHFRRAIELQPDSVPVRGRMVDLLLSMGQDAEAADVLKEIVQRQPGSVAALLELGYLSARLKRYDEAADAAQRVLRIAPNNADAQALLTLSHPAAQPASLTPPQPTGAGQAKAGQPAPE